jgi:hypothetical protein
VLPRTKTQWTPNVWERWHCTSLDGFSAQTSTSASRPTPQPRLEYPTNPFATYGWTSGRRRCIADISP